MVLTVDWINKNRESESYNIDNYKLKEKIEEKWIFKKSSEIFRTKIKLSVILHRVLGDRAEWSKAGKGKKVIRDSGVTTNSK